MHRGHIPKGTTRAGQCTRKAAVEAAVMIQFQSILYSSSVHDSLLPIIVFGSKLILDNRQLRLSTQI